jgi:hypothetical protein
MILSTCGTVDISDPSASTIAEVLATLPESRYSFAILGGSELTYMQATRGPADGFVLEYQVGSIEQRYWSVRQDLPLGTVTQAFQLYAAGDESWRNLATWKKTETSGTQKDTSRTPFRVLPIAFVALGIVAALLWWWRAA